MLLRSKWVGAALIGLFTLSVSALTSAFGQEPQATEPSLFEALLTGQTAGQQTGQVTDPKTEQGAAQEPEQVNINEADAETLAKTLAGIGMVKAQDIVAYREMYGDFTSVDELLEVKGVGPATLERNRHRITIR